MGQELLWVLASLVVLLALVLFPWWGPVSEA